VNEFDQQQPPSLRTVGNEGLQSGAQPLGGGMPINAVAELVVDLLARHGSKARKMGFPFGPFLALGAILALFWGDQLLEAYLSIL